MQSKKIGYRRGLPWLLAGVVAAGCGGPLDDAAEFDVQTAAPDDTPSLSSPALSTLPENGDGWSSLESKVDALARDVVAKHNLPGLIVAVSKDGRLKLNKAYGYSSVKHKTHLLPIHASRLGSAGKALITGPSAYQLLLQHGHDPKTTKLYGSGGLFKGRFDDEFRAGVARFTPIVAMDISANNVTYTWYADGTFSRGSTTNLAAHNPPDSFNLPKDQRPIDIREIAINNKNEVYTWYDDGSYSIGTPSDLRATKYVKKEKNGFGGVSSAYGMQSIVGIAFAKSDNDVYTWYDNGTVTIGTPTDLDAKSAPKSVDTYPFCYALRNARAFGISSSDQVYAWITDGTRCIGNSVNVGDKHGGSYTAPSRPNPDWNSWYREITTQHLFDHSAGFTRSGDSKGTARYFKKAESDLTYADVHSHFLRTRKLQFRPGTQTSYSNHGFGTFTLVVEELAKMPYRSYVDSYYLKPMGLLNKVRPNAAKPTIPTALPHTIVNGSPQAIAMEDSTRGLAAGGWSATASDALLIMRTLSNRYTVDELDSMGWARAGKKLAHDGLIGGGTAYAAMFTDGYVSQAGTDLSNVHVVVLANVDIEAGSDVLRQLTSEIALAVPEAKVPHWYDLWGALKP